MKLFALYNGCFWLVLTSLDDLMDNLGRINHLESSHDFFIETLISGKAIYVNSAGGWHIDEIDGKEHYIPSKTFPTEKEAQDLLKLNVA